MNKRNIGEIRRRLSPDKNNIARVCGCYVNEKKEIISTFTSALPTLPLDEAEKYLGIFRRTLAGTRRKNLIDIEFSPQQVAESESYKLLNTLRKTGLKDEEAVKGLFNKIIESVTFEEGYVILLMQENYDVAFKTKNDEDLPDGSENVFNYIICSICPIKMTKSALSYDSIDKNFHSSRCDWIVTSPVNGFMFPQFEGRGANIHGALFYTRSSSADNSLLADTLFNAPVPMPASAQKYTFQSVLSDSLEDECSFEVVCEVREKICDIISGNKEIKNDDDHVAVSKNIVKHVLRDCGVSEEKVENFGQKYDEEFGKGNDILPENIVNTKQFEIKTPDVQIRVNPEKEDLVDVRVIDGVKYVLVRAEDGVEVNGVFINISKDDE